MAYAWFASVVGSGGGDGRMAASRAATRLQDTSKALEARVKMLRSKIAAAEKEMLREYASGNKPRAKAAMQRKKMYEKQLAALEGQIVTLEHQTIAIQSNESVRHTFEAMRDGNNAMRSMQGTLDTNTVAELTDELSERLHDTDEIGQMLAQPVGDSALVDDDELDDELAALAAADDIRADAAAAAATAAAEASASRASQQRRGGDDDEQRVQRATSALHRLAPPSSDPVRARAPDGAGLVRISAAEREQYEEFLRHKRQLEAQRSAKAARPSGGGGGAASGVEVARGVPGASAAPSKHDVEYAAV